jgi:hypothetical protein
VFVLDIEVLCIEFAVLLCPAFENGDVSTDERDIERLGPSYTECGDVRMDVGEWFIERLTGSADVGDRADVGDGVDVFSGGDVAGETSRLVGAVVPPCVTMRTLLIGFEPELSVDPKRETLPCPADSMLRRGTPSLDGGDGARPRDDVGLCVKGPLSSTDGSWGDPACAGGDVARGCSAIGEGRLPPLPGSVVLRCGLSTVVESIEFVLRCVIMLLRSDIGVRPRGWDC